MLSLSVFAFADVVGRGGFYVVVGGVAWLLLWSTVAGKDLWPFSHYPMFGGTLDGTAVRFFRLQLHLPGGRVTGLSGLADALVDPFNRECERLWAEGVFSPAADAVLLRTWREACRLDPALTAAEKVEVVLRIAQVLAGGKIMVAEKAVHGVATDERRFAG